MSISNSVPPKTPAASSGSHKALTFAYRVEDGIYLNITNRCTNRCEFCIRNNADGAYGSDSLWLEREPTAEEVVAAVEKLYFPACKEFVFCGYGEPMMRLDTLLEVAASLKARYPQPIRINTNGQAPLFEKRDVPPMLQGRIDVVSISLNCADAEAYTALCHPVYGSAAYDALQRFATSCVPYVGKVQFSVVGETLSPAALEQCRAVAEKCGVALRVRTYIGKN